MLNIDPEKMIKIWYAGCPNEPGHLVVIPYEEPMAYDNGIWLMRCWDVEGNRDVHIPLTSIQIVAKYTP